MNSSSVLMTPLPKITVQRRKQKLTNKIPQMIKKLGKKRQIQILEQRSQGFWIEDEVKNQLDRIRLRTNRMKTMQLAINSHQYFQENQEQKGKDRRKTTLPKYNSFFKKDKEHNVYLPELNQFIISRKNESDSLIKAKRRKIMHLLVLGLNRRNSGRLYQALDIVLLASFYFDRDDEERQLKTLCLALISKLHKQIKKQHLCIRRKSKINKRRKSLTVVNYLSRQNFMQNFMQKLRKTKLVGQFSYEDSKKHKNNMRRINAKCDVMIPKPEQIFEQELQVKNYDYVAITVDDYTNMFPYEYPKSLNEKIGQLQYRQIICKLNGLLVPESKCYSFSSILKIFYLPFMLIFMIMSAFTMVRTLITSETSRIILMAITLSCILMLSIKICWEESGYTNYIEIKDKMKAYLEAWQAQYEPQHIKFRMGENVDAIFIVFPSETDKSSHESSQLTEIQQVDQNYTDNLTDQVNRDDLCAKNSQSLDRQSLRGDRKTTNKFNQLRGLIKKPSISKFASLGQNETQNKTSLSNQEVRRKQNRILSGKRTTNKHIEGQIQERRQINCISECQSRLTQSRGHKILEGKQIQEQQILNYIIHQKTNESGNSQDRDKLKKPSIKKIQHLSSLKLDLEDKININKNSFNNSRRKKTTVKFAQFPMSATKRNQISVKTSGNINADEKQKDKSTSIITRKIQHKNQISGSSLITPKTHQLNETGSAKFQLINSQQNKQDYQKKR